MSTKLPQIWSQFYLTFIYLFRSISILCLADRCGEVEGLARSSHDFVVVEGALGVALAGGEDEVVLLRGQVEALLSGGGLGDGEGVLQLEGRGHRAGAEDGAGLETLTLKKKERLNT